LNARPEGGETLRTEAKSGEEEKSSSLETTIGGASRGLLENLAHALALAAEAGQWGVVATLARQLENASGPPEKVPLRVVREPHER
jgi:hypothetical protein